MKRILLIEDDYEISALLSEYLHAQGYEVTQCYDGLSGEAEALKKHHDLIILDIMLPHKDGLALMRDIQGHISTPVLMLTAKGETFDKVLGLELGADDYLAKPFDTRELMARIKALLRRVENNQRLDASRVLKCGKIRLDEDSRAVFFGDTPIELTGKEFNILHALMQSPNKVIPKAVLYEQALGRKLSLYDRALDMHISNLRKKFPAQGIKTIRGVGYLLSRKDESDVI
ncbi:MAG: DNA-binding response regulator [Phototrophicales bacterium]|nr:MAG: DNA-binding response regulator [Phototrophicales bacterium]